MQQFAYTTGENATDGTMIIDVMDLLYTGRLSSFCIVSSDSDFTRLAARIREQGVTVYGFDERKTNNAFIAACDKFVYFDVLPMPTAEVKMPLIQHQAPQSSPNLSAPATTTVEPFGPRPIDKAGFGAMRRAIVASMDDGDNCADLANVGHYLRRISHDLNARNYGYRRLEDFVEASRIVDVRLKTFKNRTPVVLVRLEEHKPAKRNFDQIE
ncbi:hypothetical protein BU25DRAFT_252670 [Macroventuria anomochaeta]|uniref:Uncharacterized protein n=1 Tax=Macroventuria anomochaeta TaxID=301207 RepID=A0ACB6RH28_9PLEO|nr:uncharacterized protein BU25DRAFT_252670 [Macroventuria anomochaeta]KAF2621181.1 hypothetical protein BU25DRAFT_252670 [Macroventuria anomochaeta]